jgi:hypothetical protein
VPSNPDHSSTHQLLFELRHRPLVLRGLLLHQHLHAGHDVLAVACGGGSGGCAVPFELGLRWGCGQAGSALFVHERGVGVDEVDDLERELRPVSTDSQQADRNCTSSFLVFSVCRSAMAFM